MFPKPPAPEVLEDAFTSFDQNVDYRTNYDDVIEALNVGDGYVAEGEQNARPDMQQDTNDAMEMAAGDLFTEMKQNSMAFQRMEREKIDGGHNQAG